MSLFRNTAAMAITMAFRLIAGFLAFVIVARHLGASPFGTFMYWMTVSSLAALLVGFGTGPYMLKELGAHPEAREQIVGSVGAAKLFLTALVCIASLVATPWLEDATLLYWCLLVTALADIFAEYIFCAFRATNDFMTEVWFSTATSCAHLGLLLAAVALDAGVLGIAITFMSSRALATVAAGVVYCRRFKRFGIQQHWRSWRQTLGKNKAYAADSFLTNIYTQIDSLLLKNLSGPEALGVYQAGLRLMQGLNNIAPVLSNVYLPKISSELKQKQDHSRTAGLLYAQLVGFGLLVALGFAIFSTPLVQLLYGSTFESLSPLLPWFGALLLLRLFASNFGILLTASGHQSSRAWSNAICLVIIIISGYLLVPTYGAQGMVWSTLLATTILALIYLLKTCTTSANPRWGIGQIAFSAAGFIAVLTLLLRLNAIPARL